MTLYLVDEVIDVRVPYTQIMIEPRTEEKNQTLIEGETHDASGMLPIDSLLAVINSIP